jgi:dsDNA-specific endonuclease/ATPase MutS2
MPSTKLNVVKNRLNETTEAKAILAATGHVPFPGISNISHIINQLEKGIILEPVDLLNVSDFLRGCRKIKKFMLDHEFYAPTLASYAGSITAFRDIEEDVDAAIKGAVVDSSASRELKRIRKQIETVDEKITERLNKFLKSSENKKHIQEYFISQKNGHYTIPIKSASKNQIAGNIIEISTKGSTVFVEPHTISKLSSEMLTLKAEESMEIYQILATLSGMILENIHPIKINIESISQYDMAFAKGKYSLSIDGIEPKLNNHGYIKLLNCKHPLLNPNAVPLNFEIGQDYRSLIITGPNAGGKTIVLKTIGSLTLATLSGFHISGEVGTEIAVFDHVFVDIGDNQSLENALSTFSSHMKNMAEIMEKSTHNTLLLFDEIGSGTEPNEGAALAIAILETVYLAGCITVASTHYGEIKRYSELHDDFMNAAMQFNNETLQPLYKLLIGKSGESNALWIANKMNISEHVQKIAKNYMENKSYNLQKVNDNKIRKPKRIIDHDEDFYDFKMGDRVKLMDYDKTAIIYKGVDTFNNVVVFYEQEFIEVNIRRLSLDLKAVELYPEGYDMNQLFTDFKERKFQHDMERGSKKALRKVQKEIRKSNGLKKTQPLNE